MFKHVILRHISVLITAVMLLAVHAFSADAISAEMLTAECSNIQLTSAGRTISGSVEFTLNQQTDFDKIIYLELWKDGLLWDVITAAEISSDLWSTGSYTTNLYASVTEGLPQGIYSVKAGIHQLSVTAISTELEISAPEESDRTYKPLGNGRLYSKKTGKTHLWYFNQNHAMIWDGKPYIPMGGMLSSQYITYYLMYKNLPDQPYGMNVLNQYWKDTVSDLEMMKNNGITDLYLNPVSAYSSADAEGWQKLIDYWDENGFHYGIQLNAAHSVENSTIFDGYFIRANESSAPIKTPVFTVSDLGVPGVQTAAESTAKYPPITGYAFDYDNPATYEYKNAGLYAVVNSQTGETVQTGLASVTLSDSDEGQSTDLDGSGNHNKTDFDTLTYSANLTEPLNAGTYYVCFTPRLQVNHASYMDFWGSKGDQMIAQLEAFLQEIEFGDGLRLFVDPIINEQNLHHAGDILRPYSEGFNREFAEWLRSKYKTIDELNAAWAIAPALLSFEEAVQLIPVHTGQKGTSAENAVSLTNPQAPAVVYNADIRDGVMWDDTVTFREWSTQQFNNEVADAIKAYANVPVVNKQVAAFNDYNVSTSAEGGMDGVGAEAYADYTVSNGEIIVDFDRLVNESMAFTTAEVEAYEKTSWHIVTETNIDEDVYRKYYYINGTDVFGNPVAGYSALGDLARGYPNKETMFRSFNTLFDYGAKGIYDFVFAARHHIETHEAYSYAAKPVMYEWLGEYCRQLYSSWNIEKITERYCAYEPYYVYPDGGYPFSMVGTYFRTSVLYGDDQSQIFSRMLPSGRLYSYTTDLEVDADTIFINIQDQPLTNRYAKEIEEKVPKLLEEGKNIVLAGFRNDLGNIPYLDKYFAGYISGGEGNPEYSSAGGVKYQRLNPNATDTVQVIQCITDGSEQIPYFLHDTIGEGNLWIYAAGDWSTWGGEIAISHDLTKYIDGTTDEYPLILKRATYLAEDGIVYASPQIGKNRARLYVNSTLPAFSEMQNTGFTLIAAVMEGDKIVDISSTSVTVEKQTRNQEITMDISVPDSVYGTGEGYFVKYFAWNSIAGMMPLSLPQ